MSIHGHEEENQCKIKTLSQLFGLLEGYRMAFHATRKLAILAATVPAPSAVHERTFSYLRRMKKKYYDLDLPGSEKGRVKRLASQTVSEESILSNGKGEFACINKITLSLFFKAMSE
jgi:hypothetical protein